MENKTEKLKGLIGSSTILTQYERVEWLSLLELMNDKQLAELEKILVSSQPITRLPSPAAQSVGGQGSSAGQMVSGLAGKQIPSPDLSHDGRGMGTGDTKIVPKSEPIKQPPVTPMPKLSHIMNLPHIGGSSSLPANQQVSKTVSQNDSKPAGLPVAKHDNQTIKKSGFASKLKAIFAEKELPAGRTHEPLELIAGQPVTRQPLHAAQTLGGQDKIEDQSVSKAVVQKEKIANQQVSEPVSKPVVKETPMVHLAMKSESPAIPLKTEKPVAPTPPKVPTPPVKTVIQPVIIPVVAPIKIPDLPPVVIKQAVKPSESVQNEVLTLLQHKKPKTDPDFNPGVNFDKSSDKSRSENLEKIKQHMAASGSAKGVAELGKDPNISSLKDLTLISQSVLKESSETGFINKIKHLISKFGYFQVIFNIEESPVYKAYISTGLKLLTNGTDFYQLNNSTEGIEKFLDKDSFEKFADILAKIQGS